MQHGQRSSRLRPRSLALGLALLLALSQTACAPEETAPGPAQDASLDEPGNRGLLILHPSDPPPEPLPGDPPLRPYYHSFGRVPDGEVVAHTFRLKNVESEPIAISSIKPSCGCTVPSIYTLDDEGERIEGTKNPPDGEAMLRIPPQAEAFLEVRINSKDVRQKNIDKLMTIIASTDNEHSFYLRFEVHLIVENPFQIAPGEVRLGQFARSAGKKATVEIVPVLGPEIRVTEILDTSPELVATLAPIERVGNRLWVLEAGYDPPVEPGMQRGWVEVGVERDSGEATAPLRIPVIGTAVDDIVVSPTRLVFVAKRDSQEPSGAELKVTTLLKGHRFAIRQAEVLSEHGELLRTDFQPDRPDASGRSPSWRVQVEARGTIPKPPS